MKSNILILAWSACFFTSSSAAQNMTFESVKIAELSTERAWTSVEKLIPEILKGAELSMRQGGMPENVARIFVKELRVAMTKDAFSKIAAQTIASEMNLEDQKLTLAFLQSPAGAKFQTAMAAISGNQKLLLPMVKGACEATATQLSGEDKRVVAEQCRRY